ncbi:cytochrome b5 domain-containing protein [Candidatus Woesearchaeota archaeon]|nr:cytochrome b5 domain-containing protein [Candidatus Woesearchaeota archaeon]
MRFNTKIIVGISLFLSWFIIGSILVSGFLLNKENTNLEPGSNNLKNLGNSSISNIKLTIAELSTHNTNTNCWIMIRNKLYDVTNFLNKHPGEAKAIIPYCGKDATQAFQTKGSPSGKIHSNNAESLLLSFYIGDLNQEISEQTLQEKLNSSKSINNASGDDEEDEEDDDEEDD